MARRLWLSVSLALAVFVALAAFGRSARAGSKITVAWLGDPVPGGGVFAGPSFTAWPDAAGDGWIAFRAEVTDPAVREVIVARHMNAPVASVQVAALGQTAPAGDKAKFKQFLGRPTVNASGDVAFAALVTVPQASGGQQTVAAIFLLRGGKLTMVAAAGDQTDFGLLDLAAPLDPDTSGVDVPERTPALNNAGTVAFVSLVKADQPEAGIFAKPLDGPLTTVVHTNDPYDDGVFTRLGPPALNAAGTIAFHGTVAGGHAIDGIFATSGGAVTLLVGSGLPVHLGPQVAPDQVLAEFGDQVALDDAGAVAFTAGPLTDPSINDDAPGVLVVHAGTVNALGYEGQQLGTSRVSGVTLGPAGGSAVAPPAIAPDGTVVFLVTLDGGASQVVVAAAPPDYSRVALVTFAGAGASQTPSGGTYAFARSAPVIDAVGSIAFLAQIAGGTTSEALVYQPLNAPGTAVQVGEGAPDRGFFAGAAFGRPSLTNAGTVIFRAFVAQGPTSVGIFRARGGGPIEAVVRAGDPAPVGGGSFSDLLGEADVNEAGTVVFTGQVPGLGRGVYLATPDGVHAVAVRGDSAPGPPGASFSSLGLNPSINAAGAVAFRGAIRYQNTSGATVTQDGVFLADTGGLHVLALVGGPSSAGAPFAKFRDPALSGVPSVAFRATLGDPRAATDGLFLADGIGSAPIAVAQDAFGDLTLTGFSGTPAVDAAGDLAFLAARARAGINVGPAVLSRTAAGLSQLIAAGMPGPAGGTVRGLGAPSMSPAGHIVFRASFVAGTGGTPGFLLADGQGMHPLLGVGEVTPLGGRFASFDTRVGLNDQDQLAFIGNVSGGSARSGIFLASPAVLSVEKILLRLSTAGRPGRVRVRVVLHTAHFSDGIDPTHDPIVISVADMQQTL